MTYAVETRAENTTTFKNNRNANTKINNRTYTLFDRKRNEIREICETQDAVEKKRMERPREQNDDRPGAPPIRWYENWSSASQLLLANH